MMGAARSDENDLAKAIELDALKMSRDDLVLEQWRIYYALECCTSNDEYQKLADEWFEMSRRLIDYHRKIKEMEDGN